MSFVERRNSIAWALLPRRSDDHELDELLRAFDAELELEERAVLVLDTRDAAVMTRAQRHRIADHLKEKSDDIRRHFVGVCAIVPSALARGTVSAILWLAPPGVPTKLFDTEDEAVAWANARAEALGESASP